MIASLSSARFPRFLAAGIFSVAVLFIFLPAPGAEEEPTTYDLTLLVVDSMTMEPLVHAYVSGPGVIGKYTRSDGTFTASNLKRGELELIVSCEKYEQAHVRVKLDGNKKNLKKRVRLDPFTGIILGQVSEETLARWRRHSKKGETAEVSIKGRGFNGLNIDIKAPLNENGKFAVRNVPVGTYTVKFDSERVEVEIEGNRHRAFVEIGGTGGFSGRAEWEKGL